MISTFIVPFIILTSISNMGFICCTVCQLNWCPLLCLTRQSWQWMFLDWRPWWFFTSSSWLLGSGHLESPRKWRKHVPAQKARLPLLVAATSVSWSGFSPWQVKPLFICLSFHISWCTYCVCYVSTLTNDFIFFSNMGWWRLHLGNCWGCLFSVSRSHLGHGASCISYQFCFG